MIPHSKAQKYYHRCKEGRQWKGELISESFVIRGLFVITFPLGVVQDLERVLIAGVIAGVIPHSKAQKYYQKCKKEGDGKVS